MKKIKNSIFSILSLASMCLLIFTDKAYADAAAPAAPLIATWAIGLGLVVLIILFISVALIKRIREKNDNNNKFN